MLKWLKACREIARLRADNKRLAKEIEETTGEPFRVSPEQLRRLAESAKRLDPKTIRRYSTLHPEDLEQLIKLIQSSEK